MNERFWETKRLDEMSETEWEAICDGCARCCLVKLEDEEDGTVYYTDVACKLLDLELCRCRDYANRTSAVPGCIALSPQALDDLWMMPPSCSYRRLAEGRGLPDWHHLLSGDAQTVHAQHWSINAAAIAETALPESVDLEDRLVEWPVLDEPVPRR